MNKPFDQFDPNTTQWNPNNALALATAAKLAYSGKSQVAAQVLQWGFNPAKFQFLDQADTQGFVVGNDQMILVSFRGTQPNDIKDWLTDLDLVLRPFTAGKVHKGFYDALDDVWDAMNTAISKFQDKSGQTLWFTGHSLGAALACLAVARLLFERRAPINGLYTFGQPRTGDLDFSRQFDHEFEDKTFRFVNDSDIVTRVPPAEIGFSHVGQLCFFDKADKLQTDDHFWNKFRLAVEVDVESIEDPKDIIANHAIEKYIQSMSQNVGMTLLG